MRRCGASMADPSGRGGLVRASSHAAVARALRASGRVLAVLLVARVYGVDAVASFAFAYTVATLVGLVTDLGASEHAVREIGGRPHEGAEITRAVVVLRLVSVLPAFAIAYAIVALSSEDAPPVGAIAFALAGSVSETFAAVRRGHARHDLEAAECSLPLLALGGGAVATMAGASAAGFDRALAATAIGVVAIRGGLFLMTRGLPTWSGARQLIRDSGWLFARAVLTLALIELPVILMQPLSTSRELAAYAVAARPVGLMMQTLAVIAIVYLPLLARAAVVEPHALVAHTRRLNLLHIAAVPAAFAACVVGGDVLIAISGDGFEGARTVVAALAIATLLYAGTLSSLPLIVLRRERLVVAAAGAGCVALLGAAFVLIPRWGALGAAAAAGAGFAACKVVLVRAYRALQLPVIDRTQAVGILVACAAIVGYLVAPRTLAYLPLAAGAAVSAVWSLALLRAARRPRAS